MLLEVNLRITPQQDCVNAYAPKRITDGMVCAGPVAGSGDTCQGDYVETLWELVYMAHISEGEGGFQRHVIFFSNFGASIRQEML